MARPKKKKVYGVGGRGQGEAAKAERDQIMGSLWAKLLVFINARKGRLRGVKQCLVPCGECRGHARIAVGTAQSGWEGEAVSSRKAVERADLRCVLETEPRGPGVGRGREEESWVGMEVRFGFLGSFCPEDIGLGASPGQ